MAARCSILIRNTSRNLRILEERHPVKRTRTAYIDMYTRTAARQASYMVGSIYGLMVHVRLAEEITASELGVSSDVLLR